LRFYGLGNKDSKSDQIFGHLQIAKLIRLFINKSRAIYGKDFHHPLLAHENLLKWIGEELKQIETKREKVVSSVNQKSDVDPSIQALLKSEELWTTENIRKLSEVVGRIDANSISAKRETFLKIGQMACRFQANWKDKTWTTSEIFNSAFPASLFQAVSLEDKTAASLYKALVEHGPLWTSGALHALDMSSYSITTHLPEGDLVDTRNLVESYVVDSSHAVTVYGVNTDSQMVEYADPHDFTTPRRVRAALLFDQLRAFEFNSKGAHFLKVKHPGSEVVLNQRRMQMW
jgi:hypothetical protein